MCCDGLRCRVQPASPGTTGLIGWTYGVQMGLQNGLTYPLVILLAQRHGPPATPSFDFSTSVEFSTGKTATTYCEGTTPDPGNSAANDTSLGMLLT
jgi:hypothetical protein